MADGRVTAAGDGHPDLPVGGTTWHDMAGNHVILECGAVWVLLGHLQQGSVEVEAGWLVEVGQQLGRVGNSGNSGEPHLHIHAQRPGTDVAPLGGEPVPIRLNGRYLVRNDRIHTG